MANVLSLGLKSRWMLILACLPLAAGCGDDGTATTSGGPGQGASSSAQPLNEVDALIAQLVGRWKVVALDGQPLTGTVGQPELVFNADNSVSGFSGVNQFNTTVEFHLGSPGKLELGPLAGTHRMGSTEAMKFEQVMRTRLGAVRTFDIRDDTLHLYAGDSEAITAERL
jgi:heat shock protein HslJ